MLIGTGDSLDLPLVYLLDLMAGRPAAGSHGRLAGCWISWLAGRLLDLMVGRPAAGSHGRLAAAAGGIYNDANRPIINNYFIPIYCRCHFILHNTANIHLGIPTRLIPLLGSLLSIQLPKAPDEWAGALCTHSQCSSGTGRAFASCTAATEGRVCEQS